MLFHAPTARYLPNCRQTASNVDCEVVAKGQPQVRRFSDPIPIGLCDEEQLGSLGKASGGISLPI